MELAVLYGNIAQKDVCKNSWLSEKIFHFKGKPKYSNRRIAPVKHLKCSVRLEML